MFVEVLTSVLNTGFASSIPIIIPSIAPMIVSVKDSDTNSIVIAKLDAPIAFNTPISFFLSLTVIIIINSMITDPAINDPIREYNETFLILSSGAIALDTVA